MSLRKVGIIMALAPIAAGAGAQVVKKGNGYLFRLHLVKGQKIDFTVPFAIKGVGAEPLHLRFAMHMNVLKVSKDGLTTIHAQLDTGKIEMPGFDSKGGSFTVDRRGRVEDEGSSPLGFCVIYPTEPVPIGGTFVAPVPSAVGGTLGGNGGNAQATFRLVGFSGSGIRRSARLTFRVSSTKAPGGTILVRVSDGVIEKYYTSFVATPAATGKPISVVATIIRT